MNLNSSEWLTALMLVVGAVVLVIGLIGHVRWRLVLVGGLLTLAAVALIFRLVLDDSGAVPVPTPTPTSAPIATPTADPSVAPLSSSSPTP